MDSKAANWVRVTPRANTRARIDTCQRKLGRDVDLMVRTSEGTLLRSGLQLPQQELRLRKAVANEGLENQKIRRGPPLVAGDHMPRGEAYRCVRRVGTRTLQGAIS